MLFKDQSKKHKITTAEKGRIIDNVTQLYISFLKPEKSELTVDKYEITILYSLLMNIFRNESISWEVYIRDILNKNINVKHVISYLNEHLSIIDKIRILLSLIIMSSSHKDFSLQQITKILEFAKKLEIENEGFMNIFTALEHNSQMPISFTTKKLRSKEYIKDYYKIVEDSIFSDYILFGKDEICNVQFKDKTLSKIEFTLFMIDKFVFIATNYKVATLINEKKLQPFEIYLVPDNATITINGIDFTHDIILKLYANKDNVDEITFKKDAFNFNITINNNRFTMFLHNGTVYKNRKVVPRNRTINLMYDDIFTIKGYANFNIFEFFASKIEIGSIITSQKELFISYNNDFYSISTTENANCIINIENQNNFSKNSMVLYPPIKKGWELFLNNIRVTEPTVFYLNTDIITINKRNFHINNFLDLVEIPFELDSINILDIKHYFTNGNQALDSISFDLKKGEIVGVLGQSGCGKSTLLKTVCGEIFPTYGSILYDGKNYYQNIGFFSQYVGYVPQDDILFTHLTVFENLFYRGKLRIPKITDDYLIQKIDKILMNTNLIHKKNKQVGDFKNKFLSGGERKRLNLALELLFDPTIIICDEPTSGLSYTDAEQIIDILKQFSQQDKFVILTIHQPNTAVFHKFDKILMLDKGGKQVFFGKPNEIWDYFDMEYDQIVDSARFSYNNSQNIIQQKKSERLPEYINLVVEYPEYNESGDIIYEQINKEIIVKRKFSPTYWRDKYKRKILFDMIQFDRMSTNINISPIKRREKKDFFTRYTQILIFIKRNMRMKLRNITNMLITFGQVIILAIVISFILRLAPSAEPYSFNQNINIGIFIFISVIIFIFLGMSNSMEEILIERKNFIREKMLNIKVSNFLSSKMIVLAMFSLVQVFIYIAISFSILQIKGMFAVYSVFLFTASLIGCSIGVFISSFLSDTKSIINIIPLILIPQIIFGGAIIEFEKMNRNITFVHTNPIPEVVKTMPSYWLFEGLYTAQAKLNKHDIKMNAIDRQRRFLIRENHSTVSLNYKTEEVNINFPRKKYQNEYINISVNLMDGRLLNTKKNVFLSSMKWIANKRVPTYIYNLFITLIYISIINLASVIKLKYFYKE